MQTELLTTEQAAEYLGVSRSFLEHDRLGLQRVPFVRPTPRRVRYRRASLDAYLVHCEHSGILEGELT